MGRCFERPRDNPFMTILPLLFHTFYEDISEPMRFTHAMASGHIVGLKERASSKMKNISAVCWVCENEGLCWVEQFSSKICLLNLSLFA